MRWKALLLVVAALALATAVGAEPVTVRIDLQGRASDAEDTAVAAQLHMEHAGGELVGPGERTIDVTDRVVELDLPASTWWSVRLEAPGWWSPPTVLTTDAGEARLVAYRTGTLKVATRTARNAPPPEELSVHFQPPPAGLLLSTGEADDRDGGPRGTAGCHHRETRTEWICVLPAGTHDLRFRAPDFASVFRWATTLEPGKRHEIPPLDLVPGAALFGWIDWPVGDLAPDDVIVRLTPSALAPDLPQARRMASSVHPSDRGLFQFRALSAGTYRLHVEAPGWAPIERLSLNVLAGRETELLNRLEFLPPAKVEICVQPPAPPGVRVSGDTWRLTLYPDQSEFRPPVQHVVGETGCWTADDLRPGRYRLVIEDDRDSRWIEEDVLIDSGNGRLDFDLPLVPIEGEISRDGFPVRAKLTFRQLVEASGSAKGYERAVVIFSDPEGRFTGALPSDGLWHVGAAFSMNGGEQLIASVDVERPSQGAYEMSLEVSDIRLEGKVVTASGVPVRSATVRLLSEDEDTGYSRARTDRQGHFEFEGMAPGTYRVFAIAREGSTRAQVVVQEVPPPPELQLVLVKQRQVDGLVIGRNGPVFGAQVQVYPEFPSPRQTSVPKATTNAQGHFKVEVPVDATSLRVLVLAPGHAATALRVVPETYTSLVLPVDELAGTLILDGEERLPQSARLFFNGVPIFLSQLQNWLHIQGGEQSADRWVLPGMAIGDYQICPPASAQSGSCTGTYLPPLSTRVLSLRGSDHAND